MNYIKQGKYQRNLKTKPNDAAAMSPCYDPKQVNSASCHSRPSRRSALRSAAALGTPPRISTGRCASTKVLKRRRGVDRLSLSVRIQRGQQSWCIGLEKKQKTNKLNKKNTACN